MSIINKIEILINEIESLLKNQNLGLNENNEISDLIKTKRELIRRIEKEFLGDVWGIKRALSHLNEEQSKSIFEFLGYLQSQLFYLKELIEKELVLDESGEIEREIEILHFELKTILGIKDNEYFKNLVGLHTRVSQNEGKVLKQHKNLISEEIKILTSTFNFSKEYREKLKEVFSTNKGIFLLRLLKENCENDKTYKDILGYGFAYGILQNTKIQQLEVNELLEVIREFINLRKGCEGDGTYQNILFYGFAYGILKSPRIQQLEVNELLEVIRDFGKEFVNLRKDCEGDKTYKYILGYGFVYGILQNPKIKQLEVNELLEVIRDFGKEFVNLRKDCEGDKTYKYILGYGFVYGILQNPKIKQLEVNELLEVIRQFVNLKKDCEGDETYEYILEYGFAYGILQNLKIKQLEVNELLEVIREFINLRKGCEGDKTYKNILEYGFAYGILQNSKIQQLEVNELLEVIREFGKTLIRVVDDLHKRENVLSLFTYLIPVIINTSSSDFDKDKETILKNIEKNLTILLSDINNSKNYSNFYDIKYLFKNKIYCFHSVNAYFGGMTGNRTLKKSPLENLKKCLTNSVNFTPSCSIFREGKEFTIVGSFGIILNFGYIYKSYISDGRTIEEGNYENKNVNVYRINKGEYDSFLKERERARKNKEKIKTSNIINNQFSPYLILKYCSNLENEVIVRNWTPFAIFYIKGKFNELDKLKEISDELSFKKYRNGEKFYRRLKIWNREDDFIEKVFPIYEVDQEKGTLKKVYEPIKK